MDILLSAGQNANAGGLGGVGGWGMIIYIVVIVAAMYFLLIRPQSKQKKKEQQLRDSIQVGDEIITIGGFYGRVMSVKDDDVVIESLADKTKQRILKSAISQNLTIHEEVKK